MRLDCILQRLNDSAKQLKRIKEFEHPNERLE